MTVQTALRLGRAAAESRMLDTCSITKPGSGARVLDPATGKYVDPAPVVVYEGKCRIPAGGGALTKNGSADQSFGVGEYPIDLPALGDSEAVTPNMTLTYLSSATNPSLVGMVFGITEPLLLSQGTKLRFKMKAAVSR